MLLQGWRGHAADCHMGLSGSGMVDTRIGLDLRLWYLFRGVHIPRSK